MEDQSASSNVTPEEQKQYDTLLVAARGIIFGDPKKPDSNSFEIFLKRLDSGAKIIGPTIGQTAAMILSSIKHKVEESGGEVPDTILFHAGEEIIGDLIEIAVAAKIMPEEKSEQVAKQAMFEGLRVFGEGELKAATPEKRAAAQQEFQAAKAGGGIVASKMEA